MADLSQGVPERVWSKALQLGIHNDCIVASEPCERCESHVMLAFELFYGDSETVEEVLDRIVEDLATDMLKAMEH